MRQFFYISSMFFLPITALAQSAEPATASLITRLDSTVVAEGLTPSPGAPSDEAREVSAPLPEQKPVAKVFSVPGLESNEILELAVDYVSRQQADYKAYPASNGVQMPVRFTYSGDKRDCVQSLELRGTVKIETKDNKTRVLLDDLEYSHLSLEDKQAAPVIHTAFITGNANECAPESGDLDLLFQCSKCRSSVRSVKDAVQEELERQAEQYKEYLEAQLIR